MSEALIWHDHFLRLCINHAQKSKDPNTRVGALIVDRDRDIVAHGLNEFPRGIACTHGRWNDREEKLRLVVHAECNAICAAAMAGSRVVCSTLYLAATDDTGAVWGGPPCTKCTTLVIQAGIRRVISRPRKAVSKWQADLDVAAALLVEAMIEYLEVPEGG
jgi:dCMP deaminase